MKVVLTKSAGRHPNNDWVLRTDEYVSQFHCQFLQDEYGNVYIRDLGSINGTYVNYRKIGYEQTVQLHPGDKIRIGKTEKVVPQWR